MQDNVIRSLSAELLDVQQTLGWMDLVIGSITDAVYVTDTQSRLIFANQHFADLLGVPRVFLLGQCLEAVFSLSRSEDKASEFLSDTAAAAKSGSITGIYTWYKDERKYIFKISSRNLPTTSQTVYIAQDITDEYELSLMKSTFINIASHQLRTPMTAIMAYSHMLHDGYSGGMDTKQKELARSIMVSSERMIRLINDILVITRIQNDETNLQHKDVSLKDVFNTIESEVCSRIEDKQIIYSKKIPDMPGILFNSFLMHEILSNLIMNAIQYTPDGGKIKVVATFQKNGLTVSIKDTGIGIPKEYIGRIFEQFSRADNAFEVFNEGTGLGLYVVKILLAQIGGTIDCKSRINTGTTFTVSVPV